ncbi:transcriptional regulator, AraC family protein [Oleiphilus messinensis]|uniref:Transcriptional regulator, AraC family protein n=1 Tax=Oleiphilus messinensis TaxID=141451 RepID=A0A1Y0I217_9GAMM|nr:helix-turn-helix domain-containing protein [Oleiphilus messinensis]ARU54300.1 transcriptional regulator, AraC family protein [Oleiphilus messinensis]
MDKNQSSIKIAYLIPDQYWSSTVTSAVEVFHGMALSARTTRQVNFNRFEISLLRTTRKNISGFSGFKVDTRCFADPAVRDIQFDAVVVPSVWELSGVNLKESRAALDWLRDQHENGSIIAGLVTGVFYLAEAGLLDGREATIHWASVNMFKQRYPNVKVTPQLQMVEADRVITTSSTPATFDVAILLIQRFLGDRAAEFASHYFTIRAKDAPLPRFLEPSCNDTLVDAARDAIRLNYSAEISLDTLAKQLNVTARTLSRRFVSATGHNPIQYLMKQRLNIARSLLQSTDLQIQQIAEQSGFGSATVFCRNFKKEFSQTPSEYRESLPSRR